MKTGGPGAFTQVGNKQQKIRATNKDEVLRDGKKEG